MELKEHRLSVRRTARYFAIGNPEGAREVWVVCHGYGQLAARFLEKFRVLADARRYLVAPEGLSRFYISDDPAERRVGASWMTREHRLAEIDDYVRYLDAVYADVCGPLDRSRVTVVALGFSQGAATVSRWAAMGTSRIDRLVLWGGELPPDLDLSVAADRLRAVKLSLVYGRHDEFFTPKVIAETEARLREHRVSYDLTAFDGGHELDGALLEKLAAAWVTGGVGAGPG